MVKIRGLFVHSLMFFSALCLCFRAHGQGRDVRFDRQSILVQFRHDPSEVDRFLAEQLCNGRITWQSRYVPSICRIDLDFRDPELAIERLTLLENIEVAEQNPIGEPISGCPIPFTANDPLFSQQWIINNTGQFCGSVGSDMNLDCAWTITSGEGQIVAVLDAGLSSSISGPEFSNRIWSNTVELAGLTGVDDDSNGYIDDFYGWNFNEGNNDTVWTGGQHGTHCAGILAANIDNGIGISGVAPKVTAMILRIAGLPSTGNEVTPDMFMKSVEYGLSFGVRTYSISRFYPDTYSKVWYNHTAAVESLGVVLVCGAGNNGADLDPLIGLGAMPATFAATLNNVIAVAATNPNDQLCAASQLCNQIPVCGYSSNFGKNCVTVAAPGGSLWTTEPDAAGQPAFSIQGGTSLATPAVAGVVAMVRGTHPTWTPAQIKSRIKNSVRPVAGLVPFTVAGGVVDAYAAVQP